MNSEEIRKMLENHKKWLFNETGGIRADLCGANLREADLCGANLREADLRGANLCGADLRGTNLYHADLCEADLRGAYLYDADLCGADLRGANLREADLCGADLRGTYLCEVNLRGANLRGVDLRGANLRGADLRRAILYEADLCGANLRGADLYEANLRGTENIPTYVCPLVCPEEGSFIGFKKAIIFNSDILDDLHVIVKLKVLENAKRSSATTRKCRCSEAEVISITSLNGNYSLTKAFSAFNPDFMYEVGKIVAVDNFDENRWNECSTGIHFFITRDEAVNY